MKKNIELFELKTNCSFGSAEVSVPADLPIRESNRRYTATLNSSNPDEIFEVLNFLFKHSALNKNDVKTLKAFSSAKISNSLILNVFLDQYLKKMTVSGLVSNPNTIAALKLAEASSVDEIVNIITVLVGMKDSDAYKLGLMLVDSKIYSESLLYALLDFKGEEVSQQLDASLEKAIQKINDENVKKALKGM